MLCNLLELTICFLTVLVIPNQSFLFQLQFLCLRDLAFYFMITVLTYFPISFGFTIFFSALRFTHSSVSLCTAFLKFHTDNSSLHVQKSVEQKQACKAKVNHLFYCLVNDSSFFMFFSVETIPMKK